MEEPAMTTPQPTPQPSLARRITPEDQPVFPCWLYGPKGWLHFMRWGISSARYEATHWHPHQREAPAEVPEQRYSPFDDPIEYHQSCAGVPGDPTPTIPPATGGETPTPRTDEAAYYVPAGWKKLMVDYDFARQLERELAGANARLDAVLHGESEGQIPWHLARYAKCVTALIEAESQLTAQREAHERALTFERSRCQSALDCNKDLNDQFFAKSLELETLRARLSHAEAQCANWERTARSLGEQKKVDDAGIADLKARLSLAEDLAGAAAKTINAFRGSFPNARATDPRVLAVADMLESLTRYRTATAPTKSP
jgi:hypothetical protein